MCKTTIGIPQFIIIDTSLMIAEDTFAESIRERRHWHHVAQVEQEEEESSSRWNATESCEPSKLPPRQPHRRRHRTKNENQRVSAGNTALTSKSGSPPKLPIRRDSILLSPGGQEDD